MTQLNNVEKHCSKLASPFRNSVIEKTIEIRASISNREEALQLLDTAKEVMAFFNQKSRIQCEVQGQPGIDGLTLEKTCANPWLAKPKGHQTQSETTLSVDDTLSSHESHPRTDRKYPKRCQDGKPSAKSKKEEIFYREQSLLFRKNPRMTDRF